MMFLQLPLVGWIAWSERTVADVAALVCVLVCWGMSFAVSVPLHNKIDAGDTRMETLEALVNTNWPRTILWTAAFILGLF